MSRICPETGEKVVYLECQDCDERLKCLSMSKQEAARKGYGKTSAKSDIRKTHRRDDFGEEL